VVKLKTFVTECEGGMSFPREEGGGETSAA